MIDVAGLFQSADWKAEKHVPVIDAPETVTPGEFFSVEVTVGKEIPHPNTTAHHIRWIVLYFQAEGEKFPFEIARVEFNAHGESAQGPDTGSAYTHPKTSLVFKTAKPGRLLAASFCNIHGLWQSQREIKIK